MTSCTGSVREGFWEIWEKSVELSSWLGRRRLAFASSPKPGRGLVSGAHVMGGGADGNVVIERLCLSLPYVEKPLNLKVTKSFVPELRNHKCFSCFGIRMSYIYMSMNIYVRFTYPYHGYATLVLLSNILAVFISYS